MCGGWGNREVSGNKGQVKNEYVNKWEGGEYIINEGGECEKVEGVEITSLANLAEVPNK